MKKHFYKDRSNEGVRNAIAGIATMIIYGAELGLSPTQAFRTMHVIEGAPSLSAAGKVALVKRSPKCYSFEVIEESDEHCTCETIRLRADGSKLAPRRLTVRIWWKDPKEIPESTPGILYVLPTYDKEGHLAPAWARTPGRMAKARCSSWLCDNVYEDVTHGLYSTEEIIDFADRRSPDRVVEDIFSLVDDAPAKPGGVEASDEPASPPVVQQETPVAEPAPDLRARFVAYEKALKEEFSEASRDALAELGKEFVGTEFEKAARDAWAAHVPKKGAA
jgi:hypothetical protein